FSRPRNTSLNWFIPALVKSSVGSPCGTSDELRKRLCPLPSKKRRNISRISFPLKTLFSSPPTAGARAFSLPLTCSSFFGANRLTNYRRTSNAQQFQGRNPAALELLSERWSAIIHESVRTKERGT